MQAQSLFTLGLIYLDVKFSRDFQKRLSSHYFIARTNVTKTLKIVRLGKKNWDNSVAMLQDVGGLLFYFRTV